MKHGIAMLPPAPDTYAHWCRLSEEAGFDVIWVPDSQSLYRALYVSCAICAANTSSVLLGPNVTNPLTRHPATAASAIATVDEFSGGRALFGIATGDSAVLNLGLRPGRVDDMRDYVLAMRGMLEEGAAHYRGKPCTLSWHKKRVPLYIAAEGPRTIRLAGEVADGVTIGTGLTPEVVADSLTWLEEGARKSGRKLSDLDIWWLAKVNVREDGETAREEIRMALAASAHHAFRFTLEGRRIPKELRSAVETLKKEYAFHEHEMVDKQTNAELVDRLGLREYLLDRFAIAGSPAECRKKIEDMKATGVENLRIAAHVHDKPAFIRAWGREIISQTK